ncbi:hypothetical protein QE152_g37929 [Popillia japonica]|uniref:Uncharacterized protein n=1 Tax=Popillia japonica TaxID=7064 RepID=A0AAW1I8T8_POPJA
MNSGEKSFRPEIVLDISLRDGANDRETSSNPQQMTNGRCLIVSREMELEVDVIETDNGWRFTFLGFW